VKVLDCGPTDEIFTHVDEDGTTRHFNTSAMMRAVIERKVKPDLATCPLTEGLIRHIEQNHGVEEPNIEQLPDRVLEIPVLLVRFNDTTDLLVDGNHRVVKRWRKGLKDVRALLFTEAQAQPYMVTDVGSEYPLEEAAGFIQKLLGG
jgi:hypothetical protein